MKTKFFRVIFFTAIFLFCIYRMGIPKTFHSISVDGDLSEWNTAQERFDASTGGTHGYITWDAEYLYVAFDGVPVTDDNQAVYVVLDADPQPDPNQKSGNGTENLGYDQWFRGSTIHVPFNADYIFMAKAASGNPEKHVYVFDGTSWQRDGAGGTSDLRPAVSIAWSDHYAEIRIPLSSIGSPFDLYCALYAKDLDSNSGWGWLYSIVPDNAGTDGNNDKTLTHYYGFQLIPNAQPNSGSHYDASLGKIAWSPIDPGPNDVLTITRKHCTQGGKLHWGVNSGTNGWEQPIADYWPSGSVASGSQAIETPLSGPDGSGNCSVQIGPFQSGEQVIQTVDFVFHWDDDSYDNNGGNNYQVVEDLTPGTQDPTVQINSPADSSQASAVTTITYSASGETSTELWIDGVEKYTASTPPYSYDWNTAGESYGIHLINAKAESASGRVAFDQLYLWVVPTVIHAQAPSGTYYGAKDNGDGTVTFAILAPSKQFISVIGDFNNWNPEADILNVQGDTLWWKTISLAAGSHSYQYRVDGEKTLADPYAGDVTWQENGTESGDYTKAKSIVEVGASSYSWGDGGYTRPNLRDAILYEILVGDFSPSADFNGVRNRLDYLKSLGINAIELMPMYEFPGGVSWGYNPAFYFAPESSYGTPEEFKQLVDEAHQRGIAVLVDIVFNHTDASSPLYQLYGTDYTHSPWYHSAGNPWGFPDLDHWKYHTQELTRDVLKNWMDAYHIDGFRYDACAYIGYDGTGESGHGVTYFTYKAWQHDPNVYQILEYLPQDVQAVLTTKATSEWHDTFHDQMKANLREGPFENRTYGDMDVTAQAVHYGGDGFSSETQVINYTENHDEQRVIWEVGTNGITGENARKKSKLGAAVLLTAAGVPMLYHGQEWGEATERTINRNPIHWSYLDSTWGGDLHRYYQRLIWLRNHYPALRSDNLYTTYQNSTTKCLVYQRWKDDGTDSVVVAVNFNNTPQTIAIPFPTTGTWYEFTEDGQISVTTSTYSVTLPASTARIFCKEKRWEPLDVTPPAPVTSVSLSTSHTSLVLSWSAVTTDTAGNAESVSYYNIYRSTNAYFNPGSSNWLATTTQTSYTDSTSGVTGTVGTNYFYTVKAVDEAGNASDVGQRVGEFDFVVRETTGSDFSWIGLPVQIEGVSSASELATFLQNHATQSIAVEAVGRWNGVGQNFTNFTTTPFPSGDFTLNCGDAIRISTAISGADSAVVTLCGTVPDSQSIDYSLYSTTGTDFSWILLPLQKTSVSDAAQLKDNIETNAVPATTVEAISMWNSAGQNFTNYTTVPFPAGNFKVNPGYPYRISLSIAGSNEAHWH